MFCFANTIQMERVFDTGTAWGEVVLDDSIEWGYSGHKLPVSTPFELGAALWGRMRCYFLR